jgi:hypothetical protein
MPQGNAKPELSHTERSILYAVDHAVNVELEENGLGDTLPLKAVDNPRWVWFYQQKRNRVFAVMIPALLSYVFGALHPTGPIHSLVTHSPRLMWLQTLTHVDVAMMLGSALFGLILFAMYELVAPAVKMQGVRTFTR